jgi:hypothetical protein
MAFFRCFAAAVVLALTAAQTPADFQPGTLVKLGVQYSNIDITPVGTQVQSLASRWSQDPEW